MKMKTVYWIIGLVMIAGVVPPIARCADLPPRVVMTAEQDRQNMMDQLGMTSIRPGDEGMNRSATNFANYDESYANPYPKLPDPLVFKDGTPVTTPEMWWKRRRPEIVEDFDREVYGRLPKNIPPVTWSVVSTNEGVESGPNGNIKTYTRQLVGHVDNSFFPSISVNIQLSLTLPVDANGPSPVMMTFGGGFGGFGGGGFGARAGAFPGAPGGTNAVGRTNAFAGRFGRAGFGGFGRAGGTNGASRRGGFGGFGGFGGGRGGRGGYLTPVLDNGGSTNWQYALLSQGWGIASLNPGSIQADNGAGLTAGIIGLCNKGQPRKPDDWGALRAWAWGVDRALDYFGTDPKVDARHVGLEGHSRYGKATIVSMAYDQRLFIAYVSSSGEGGAKLFRRNWGEPVENVTATSEYHWMAGNFLKYAGPLTAKDLPVDAHELIAMCAPRPVFLSAGNDGPAPGDGWVDARGTWKAAVAAGPVYRLLGKKDLGVWSAFPGVCVPVIDGDIGFREHDGGHTDGPNWSTFIEFADKYIHGPGVKGVQPEYPEAPPPPNPPIKVVYNWFAEEAAAQAAAKASAESNAPAASPAEPSAPGN
ncbi:MAG TPA: acetylxylan esterase [Verrucomicrobiae bacterium]|nr:acetylxylan esterase [Verrucomicrobiae bacterium]